ncbi:MAG: acylphosphatase [Candidatus Woesearchaeota archaeon]
MKRVKIIVSGRVQGVFYRNFAKLEAEKLGISGFARNLRDGTVEIIAEGGEKALEQLKKQLWKGPTMSFVKNVITSETDNTEEFEGFDIR